MASTIIAPKKGENSLLKGAKKVYKKLGEGEIMNMEGGKVIGEWNNQELPSTVQGRRVRWSLSKHRWLLLDENQKELSQEALDELVQGSYLTYEEGLNKGQLITTANPNNGKDPFFNHSLLNTMLREGNGKLDKDVNKKDRLLVYGLRGHNDVGTAKEGNTSGRIRYVLSDKGEETNSAIEIMKKSQLASKYLENLTDGKRLVVAKIMGLGVNNSSNRDTVDLALYNATKTSNKKTTEGITLQELFIKICQMDSEELNLRHLIAQAKDNRVIKLTKTGYTFNGSRIASTDSGLYDYFKKPDNHEILLSLETAMGRVLPVEKDDEIN